MRTDERFTVAKIRTLGPGLHLVDKRLYLRITETVLPEQVIQTMTPEGVTETVLPERKKANRNWFVRFASPVHVTKAGRNKERDMGLGPYPAVTLAEARDLASECLKLARQGIDPLDLKHRLKAERRLTAVRSVTFKRCALSCFADRPKGKNAKAHAQWMSTIETYAFPKIGNLMVDQIDVTLLHDVLGEIWKTKHDTAKKLLSRIREVFDWAIARDYRTDNPAELKGKLKSLLVTPNIEVKHQPSLHHQDIPEFMTELRSFQSISARALEFTILCGLRAGATRFARLDELDFKANVWTIPPYKEGAKNRNKSRSVPLSDRAREIIDCVPREDGNPFIFIGGSKGRPQSDGALRQFLLGMPFYKRRVKKNSNFEITVHGFRSTFRDWIAEETQHPNELGEMALWHVIDNKTEAAYRRGDMVKRRRRMMQDWADYCAGKLGGHDGSNVVSLPLAGG